MNNDLFGKKDVPKVVRDELDLRSTAVGIKWNALRFPWIHITSLSDVCNKENLRIKTLSSVKQGDKLSKLYQRVNDITIQPFPIVTGLDIKKQGELGTTRRATVKITAFSDEQLIELQKCYFVPGLGVRLEWGWNQSCDGTKSTGPLSTAANVASLIKPDAEVIKLMLDKSATEPHYEGLQGLVANFSYNLTNENLWDCTLEVIAAAESFSRSSVSVQPVNKGNCARNYEIDSDTKKKERNVEEKSGLYTILKDFDASYDTAINISYILRNLVNTKDWAGAGTPANTLSYSRWKYNGHNRDETGAENPDFFDDFLGLTTRDTDETYLSWPTVEALINYYAVPSAQSGEYVVGRIASPMHTPIKYHPQVISSDPRICLITGPQKNLTTTFAIPQKSQDLDITPTPADNPSPLTLQHIHVNVTFMLGVLKSLEADGKAESISIHSFVTQVLDKVSFACGNLWQFEIVSRTDVNLTKGPCISVIDATFSGGEIKPQEVYKIPSLPQNSIVRDMKLAMKMTDAMTSHALYSNADQQNTITGPGGGCSANLFRPFGLSSGAIKSLNMVEQATRPPDPDNTCATTSTDAQPPKTLQEWMTEVKNKVDESTTSSLRHALQKLYGIDAKSDNNDGHCAGIILPFEFEFTIDGISGFKFGQMVSSTRIPEQIRDYYDWQVTVVEHSITPNDWTTNVKTVARYKSSNKVVGPNNGQTINYGPKTIKGNVNADGTYDVQIISPSPQTATTYVTATPGI